MMTRTDEALGFLVGLDRATFFSRKIRASEAGEGACIPRAIIVSRTLIGP